MKRKAIAVLFLVAATAVFAAAQSVNSITAEVPFQFYVGSKLLPAGVYKISATANLGEISVRDKAGKESALAPVVTRLSPRSDKESNIIFDKTGENHYLTEIYIQGMDGFQIQGTKEAHTHTNVKIK
jgi:hypothetical protein